jgi:hypothetical protein
VLRRPLPYGPVLYAPLGLLHLALLVRIGLGDAVGWEPAWRWAGVGDVAAVLGFAACAIAVAVRGSRSTVDAHTSTVAQPVPAGARR